jgi:hypothetical protein
MAESHAYFRNLWTHRQFTERRFLPFQIFFSRHIR